MRCPECKTKFMSVLETRRKPDEVIRVKECFNGHKFKTVETFFAFVERRTRDKDPVERVVAVRARNGRSSASAQPTSAANAG